MTQPSAPCRILIVDDDLSFRDGMKRTFHGMKNDLPAVILQASDGKEALERVRDSAPDVMLLDYQMPGGNGLVWIGDFLKTSPELAVIVVTGMGNERVAVEAMKAGAMDYLVKGGIVPEALQRAVASALQKRALMQTVKQQQETLLEAERQRVMIESLGAACHHLGQPATVIRLYLEMVRREEQSPELKKMLEQCVEAADNIAEILQRLQTVSKYRTVPYLKSLMRGETSEPGNIVDVS